MPPKSEPTSFGEKIAALQAAAQPAIAVPAADANFVAKPLIAVDSSDLAAAGPSGSITPLDSVPASPTPLNPLPIPHVPVTPLPSDDELENTYDAKSGKRLLRFITMVLIIILLLAALLSLMDLLGLLPGRGGNVKVEVKKINGQVANINNQINQLGSQVNNISNAKDRKRRRWSDGLARTPRSTRYSRPSGASRPSWC
jgi:hypothetical protein